MNGRSCGMNLHRTAGTTQGPGMLSGQHVPPIQAHSGTPGPLSCGSTPSPAIGSLANSLHLKMPSGGGMAPQNNMAESPIHLPALSPRRQVLTNGKPRYQVAPAGGMSGSHTLKPKQQEFGSPFPSNPGKGRVDSERETERKVFLLPLVHPPMAAAVGALRPAHHADAANIKVKLQTERETERKVFLSLVQSPNGRNARSYADLKPGARCCFLFSLQKLCAGPSRPLSSYSSLPPPGKRISPVRR